jgi:hypothetical protein
VRGIAALRAGGERENCATAAVAEARNNGLVESTHRPRCMKCYVSFVLVAALAMSVEGCSDAVSSAVPQSTTSATGSMPAQLIGAWRTKVQFKDGALSDLHDLEFMYSFNTGGTLTQSSNYDGTPPVPPGYGLWRQTGPRTFELRYAFYAPAKFIKSGRTAAWVPSGRGLYSETLELSPDAGSYTSRIVYDLVDPKGTPIPGGGEGEASGTRTTFDQ